MNRDLVIGIVGSAVLVAAMVGVFFYEKNVATNAGVGGNGTVTNATGPTATGTVQFAKSDEKILNVTQASAQNVTFKITWKATNGKDTMKVTVSPPTESGIAQGGVSDPKDTGEISVTVPTGGKSPAGGWKVKVEFTKADPAPLPGGITPPTPPPNSTDGQVGYSVAVTLS